MGMALEGGGRRRRATVEEEGGRLEEQQWQQQRWRCVAMAIYSERPDLVPLHVKDNPVKAK
jgi:hypothetical protein